MELLGIICALGVVVCFVFDELLNKVKRNLDVYGAVLFGLVFLGFLYYSLWMNGSVLTIF